LGYIPNLKRGLPLTPAPLPQGARGKTLMPSRKNTAQIPKVPNTSRFERSLNFLPTIFKYLIRYGEEEKIQNSPNVEADT